MSYPSITINTKYLTENAETMVRLCGSAGISVMAIGKACCGDISVARALTAAGVKWLGDSRLQNLMTFKKAGIDKPLCLLRLPMLSEVSQLVSVADISLVSEMATAQALSQAAVSQGVVHKIILMVDLGDLREGLLPDDVLPAARFMADLPGIELHGIGVNFACYGCVMPSYQKLEQLVGLANDIRLATGLSLPVVSGGNSASVFLVPNKIPVGITQLRLGESILLGRETVYRNPVPGCHLDAFTLSCEIIELKEKPSVPDGELCTDAFGNPPSFVDKGIRRRAILGIGRQDVIVDGLIPFDHGADILGASSDHLIMDVTDVARPLEVGSVLKFNVQYSALLTSMQSSYVNKIYL